MNAHHDFEMRAQLDPLLEPDLLLDPGTQLALAIAPAKLLLPLLLRLLSFLMQLLEEGTAVMV